MKQEIDESVKFAWAHIILNGHITTGEWEYYGSSWESVTNKFTDKWGGRTNKTFVDYVTSIGVDFKASGVPEISDQSGFNGTFASHSSEYTATLGTLVLKNGETFLLGTTDDDAAALVRTAKQMLDKKESDTEKLAKLL